MQMSVRFPQVLIRYRTISTQESVCLKKDLPIDRAGKTFSIRKYTVQSSETTTTPSGVSKT